MSANAFYREMRDLGIAARRAETLRLYSIAKGIVSRSANEPYRNINSVPSGDEIQPWPTKKAEGYMQTITLAYRERATGAIQQTYYSVKSAEPITREAAIAQAINAYSDHADRYNQDLIGAIHTSTYQLIPFIGADQETDTGIGG